MPPDDNDGSVQDDAVTGAMPDHRATVRAGLQRGAASLDGHMEEWAGEIALPSEAVYVPGGLWRGRPGNPRLAFEEELWEDTGKTGGYERVALLELRLRARLPVLRRELERHLQQFISFLEPDEGLLADELVGVVAERLTLRMAGRPPRRPVGGGAYAALVEAVREAADADTLYVGAELSRLSDIITYRGAASSLMDVLDAATTFESAASRWAAAWRVLGAIEAFGPGARELGVSPGGTFDGRGALVLAGTRRVAERRVEQMGRELLRLAESDEAPDFHLWTDTGLINWCAGVIGMSDSTARVALEDVGVIVEGEGQQGATGRSLAARLRRLLVFVGDLGPELRERVENVENRVLGRFDADSYSGAATEDDG